MIFDSMDDFFVGAGEETTAGVIDEEPVVPICFTPLDKIEGSSDFMANSNPAHPNCLSTTSGSNTPSLTYLPLVYWLVPDQT